MDYMDAMDGMEQLSESEKKWLDDGYLRVQMAKLPADAPRAALAYRVSTKGQVEKDDIPMQKIECRKFCWQHGWRVVLEKAEKGVSGSKVSAAKRDAIQELKQAAERKEFDVLVVFMFDRLGRRAEETPFVLKWFVQQGVEVWSTREGQQRMDSHTDELTTYIRFWQAEGESKKIAERVKTSIQQKNSAGEYTGGKVAFGYTAEVKERTNKKGQAVRDLVIEPEQATVVREIFRMVADEGLSTYAVAKQLNTQGVTTRDGARFQAVNVKRILRHEGYTGYLITKSARSDFMPQLQIIEPELFERANKVLDSRARKSTAKGSVAHKSENDTLLAGMVYCAHCGSKMSGFVHLDRYRLANGALKEQYKAKYHCYQKSQHLKECDGQQLYLADRVDGIVLEAVSELFHKIQRTPYNKTLEKQLRQKSTEQRQNLRRLEHNVDVCSEAVRRLEDEVLKCLTGESKFSEEVLSRLLRQKEQELADAKSEYAAASAVMQDERLVVRKLNRYYQEFMGWAEEFDAANLKRKRMILSQLLEKVEVSRGYKVTIHVKLSYQQFLEMGEQEKMEKAG